MVDMLDDFAEIHTREFALLDVLACDAVAFDELAAFVVAAALHNLGADSFVQLRISLFRVAEFLAEKAHVVVDLHHAAFRGQILHHLVGHVANAQRGVTAQHAEIAVDHMAAFDTHERSDLALFASIADFGSGRREHDFSRMLANLLAHRVDLNKGAIYGLGPGNFAGHPDGEENSAEVAFAHAGNVDAPASTALAKIELAVKKALRRVVVRVHDDGGEVQLARFFRDGIGGNGKTHKTCNGNPHNG